MRLLLVIALLLSFALNVPMTARALEGYDAVVSVDSTALIMAVAGEQDEGDEKPVGDMQQGSHLGCSSAHLVDRPQLQAVVLPLRWPGLAPPLAGSKTFESALSSPLFKPPRLLA